ncbi:MAG TPA: hypothetical protein VGK36_06285 [Candidatus Angelobacter sp.]|jgi:hypothetical protein
MGLFKATKFQTVPKVLLPSLLSFLLVALSAGCGHSSPDCSFVALFVAPSVATADHLAAAPGNKISYVGGNATPPAVFLSQNRSGSI